MEFWSSFKNTTRIPREDPQEKEERMKTVAGGKKKSEILGGPAEGNKRESAKIGIGHNRAGQSRPTLNFRVLVSGLGLAFHGVWQFKVQGESGKEIWMNRIQRSCPWMKQYFGDNNIQ